MTTFHRYFHVCGALRRSILHVVRESLLLLQREDGPDEVEVALAQERRLSGLVGVEEDGEVFRYARDLEVGQAVLHRAEELARAAQAGDSYTAAVLLAPYEKDKAGAAALLRDLRAVAAAGLQGSPHAPVQGQQAQRTLRLAEAAIQRLGAQVNPKIVLTVFAARLAHA